MKKNIRSAGVFTMLAFALAGCGSAGPSAGGLPAEARAAADVMDAGTLLGHIEVLSADEFEGRAPGTRGEELTVAYLTEQFEALGLEPGNPDGSWVQRVPLVGYTTRSEGSFRVGGRTIPLRFPDDYVAVSRRFDRPSVELRDSELVFVGYGVVAPEYEWNDFKDIDVRGKTVVMLINDPQVPDPNDPSRLDEDVFRGDAMTYYGRWTYKYEIASEMGAAGVLIVHETGPAGYPYEVVVGSWGRENFDIIQPEGPGNWVELEGWITRETAEELFQAAGHDFEELKAAAVRRDFQPVELGATANFRATTTTREVQSQNVIAKLPGSDPELRDEYVVYTAHWDHLGKDDALEDGIYNGAKDNASGTAGLLEIARAFTSLPEPPARSVLFLAVTAEEQGLLGAKYYATNPLYPLEKTLANINVDGLNQWGPTRDIVVVGYGNSTLEELLEAEARAAGRVIVPDPEPEKGFFYRSDHFEFAKVGVPALYTDDGTQFIGKPESWGEEKRAEYTANDYHKPSDEIKPDWDLTGAIEDLRLLFGVGYRVAQTDRWPEWYEGTEFKGTREAMLGGI